MNPFFKSSSAPLLLLAGILFFLPMATTAQTLEEKKPQRKKTISELAELLSAPDPLAPTKALSDLAARPPEALKEHIRALLPPLVALSSENTTRSIQALLLIGQLGDRSKAKDLKTLLKKIREKPEPEKEGLSTEQSLEKEKACLTALLLLRDAQTEAFARDSLAAETLSSRTLAIALVVRAEREDFLKDLLPLLDDDRNAVTIGPPDAPLQIKVRDLAADAIAVLSKIPPSTFRSERGLGAYTDEEIKTLQDLIVKTMSPKRPTAADAPPKPLAPRPAESSETAPTVEEILPEPKPPEPPSTTQPVPPLGLSDARNLLSGALSLLNDSSPIQSLAAAPRRQVIFRIEQVENYITYISANMAGEIIYKWHPLWKQWVDPSPRINVRFAPDEAVSGVMAISIYAKSWGSVYLSEIRVIDSSEKTHSLGPGNWGKTGDPATGDILIKAHVPRREVFFLDQPTDVLAIDLIMHHDGERKRRIYVELGVPSSPEYAREITLLCRKSLKALKNNNLSLAQIHLRQAQDRLRLFQEHLEEGKKED